MKVFQHWCNEGVSALVLYWCEAWSELPPVRECFGYAVAGLCFWQRYQRGMHSHNQA